MPSAPNNQPVPPPVTGPVTGPETQPETQSQIWLVSFLDRIDGFLERMARIGSWAALALVIVIVYDVITRRFGLPRFFGLNATQLQETEYWLHTILFALAIAHTYRSDGHVRIDILRNRFSARKKLWIELLGNLFLLIPFASVALKFQIDYAWRSFSEGASSNSSLGLTHIWILKSVLCVMFALLLLAAISATIRTLLALKQPDNADDPNDPNDPELKPTHSPQSSLQSMPPTTPPIAGDS